MFCIWSVLSDINQKKRKKEKKIEIEIEILQKFKKT